jgi:Cof subfamily protein (haloacid dehalogenase superfamily)
MNNLKLLAVDLDRTCLDSRDQIRESTMEALKTAIAAGVTVVPATGRNLLGIPKALRTLPGVNYAITSNGAAIYDLETGETVFRKSIPFEQAASLLERVGALGIPRSATIGQDVIDTTPEVFQLRHTFFHDYAESLFTEDLPAYVRARGEDVAKLHFLYMRKYDSEPVYDMLRAEPGVLFTGDLTGHTEVVANFVDKGAGLAQLARLLGVKKEETAAVGDSDNDVTMLRWAGTSVAMGGAPNHVQAEATLQTDDCDHDGLAKAVKLLLG